MGDFHCPAGALTRGSDDCIMCGLCVAVTKEEMRAATEIIRAYVRDSVLSRQKGLAIKKIAVCGKGGSGKSTVTAMLARVLSAHGYRCLVIDTDESNVGLHKKLGISSVPEPLISYLSRFSPGDKVLPERSWMEQDPLRFSMIPKEFVTSAGNISMMVSGKIDDPFQGCSCPMAEFTKKLVMNLTPEDGEVVIVDLEAGVESFGRGMEQACDTVLIITEPSFESIDLADKIKYMAEGLGIRRIRAIINKTMDDEQEEFILDELIEKDIRFLGCIPASRELAFSNLRGLPISDSPAYSRMEELAMIMLDEAEMKHDM